MVVGSFVEVLISLAVYRPCDVSMTLAIVERVPGLVTVFNIISFGVKLEPKVTIFLTLGDKPL